MTEVPSPETPRRLVTDLCRLVAERAGSEKEFQAGFVARNAAADNEYQEAQEQLDRRYNTDRANAEQEHVSVQSGAVAKFDAELAATQQEYDSLREKILTDFAAEQQAAEHALQDAKWNATETAEVARGGLNLPLDDLVAGLESRWQELDSLQHQAVALMEHRGHWDDLPEAPLPPVVLEKQPGRRFCHALEQAQAQFRALSKQLLPRLFVGVRPVGMFLLLWALAALPAVAVFGWRDWRWAAASGGLAVLVSLIAGAWIAHIARRNSVAAFLALRQTLLESGLGRPAVLEAAKAECQRREATITAHYKTQIYKADEAHTLSLARVEQRKEHDLHHADQTYPKRLSELTTRETRRSERSKKNIRR